MLPASVPPALVPISAAAVAGLRMPLLIGGGVKMVWATPRKGGYPPPKGYRPQGEKGFNQV
jgi:hypothetical protein